MILGWPESSAEGCMTTLNCRWHTAPAQGMPRKLTGGRPSALTVRTSCHLGCPHPVSVSSGSSSGSIPDFNFLLMTTGGNRWWLVQFGSCSPCKWWSLHFSLRRFNLAQYSNLGHLRNESENQSYFSLCISLFFKSISAFQTQRASYEKSSLFTNYVNLQENKLIF